MLKKLLLNEYMLVFLFCLAAIQGPAFSLMDNYDANANVDCQTYLGIARMELNQSPVRRYRPIVPAAAGAINYVCGPAFNKLKPNSFPGDFPLSLSFFIVNSILLSLWGVVIYRFCRAYGAGIAEALLGLLVMLTCRWTPYIAGTPMVDSLYCLVTGVALLGIKEKKESLVAWAIFTGPFAKEAFIFVAPVIFFFSHVPKGRQVLYFLSSGALVFGFRYVYDRVAGMPPASGLEADIYHFQYVAGNISRLFSFHGAYDVLSNLGVWLLLPLMALGIIPQYKIMLKEKAAWYMLFFMICIFAHMLLSGYFERMFFLCMPLICMFTAMAGTALKYHFGVTEK